MIKTIPKQVLQGLKSITDETLEQGSNEIKKAVGLKVDKKTDLIPDINDLSDEQKQKLENQDKKKTSQEMGRNVEREMDEVRKQKQEEEDRKEKEFLEKIKAQRQQEQEERNGLAMARGSALARGKKPSVADRSATGEFGKRKD